MNKRRIFLCVVALFWGSLYTYVPTLPGYAADIGAGQVLLGVIVGSYGFSQMMVRLPLGILSDRLKKRKVFITGGLLVSVAASAGCALFPYPGALLVFRTLSGAAASTWVTFTVLYASYFDTASTPRAISASMVALGIGQAVFSYIGSALADINPAAPFWLSAGIGILGAALSLLIEENQPTSPPATVKELMKVAGDRGLMTASGLAVLGQFVIFSTVYSFTQTFARASGAAESQLGALSVTFTVSNLIFSRIGGFLSSRVPLGRIICAGFGMIAISCVLMPFASVEALFVLQALCGMGAGFVMPMLMSLSIRDIAADKRGVAMGFFQAVYGIGMTLGPIFAGNLVDLSGFALNFRVMSAIAAVGALICFKYVRN